MKALGLKLLKRLRQTLCKHEWKVDTKRIEGANVGWLRYAECRKCKLFEGLLFTPDPSRYRIKLPPKEDS